MKVLALSKYPPIQGGTAARCYFHYRLLAEAGHRVLVVTNAAEVELDYRCHLLPGDHEQLEASFPSGGEVRVIFADRAGVQGQFVPAGDASVTRLASLALQACEQFEPDVLFCSYLEPYCVAAALTASWTGLPYVLEHAGSDRTRLLANPALGPALAQVLRGAAICFSSDRSLEGLGVAPGAITPVLPSFLPPGLFSPWGPDLSDLDLSAVRGGAKAASLSGPVLGVYGKVGVSKGSFDLLAGLDLLHREGLGFELVAMVGGRARGAFDRELAASPVGNVTTRLPFLCPWRVPEFLRSCAVVCFLERDFPVRIHGPKIAREVLASGRCLIVSEEIRRKQLHADRFTDGENVLIVSDPRDRREVADCLRRALADAGWAAEVGRAGRDLFEPTDPDLLVAGYEEAFGRAATTPSPSRRRHRPPPAATPTAGDDSVLAEYPAAYAVLMFAQPARAAAGAAASGTCGGIDSALERASECLGSDAPEWWADVLRYDAARAWLRTAPRWPLPSGGLGSEPEDPLERPARSNLYPEVTAPMKILTFGVKVHEVEGAVRRGTNPGTFRPASSATTLLFVKSADLLGRAYEISSSAAAVIPLIDGRRSCGQICEEGDVEPEDLTKLLAAFEAENALRLHSTAACRPAFADDI